jgi:2-amino-5-formylamino-6-ribosylaminopyrimidin-4(3H)-one 5'-monophosphate deformylase
MKRTEVGLIILGSQKERHGLLPEDTDTKLAAYTALRVSAQTGAKLVGIVNTATEYDYIKHGEHHHPAMVLADLKMIVQNTIERLKIAKFVIINGHGGNKRIEQHIQELEHVLGVKIAFNNHIIDLEGAHAANEECSMAAAAGIVYIDELKAQGDFERFPEVGFVGLLEAHRNPKIKKLAERTEKEGIQVSKRLGAQLLNRAVDDIVKTVQNL